MSLFPFASQFFSQFSISTLSLVVPVGLFSSSLILPPSPDGLNPRRPAPNFGLHYSNWVLILSSKSHSDPPLHHHHQSQPSKMMMLVNCSHCHTPLQLPHGARSIRCAICGAVTNIGDARAVPPPSTSAAHAPYNPVPPPALSPYNHAPPGPPPNSHGSKKAVIVGISYRYSRHELKGCINDAKCMKYLLINKFHFPESSIISLTGKGRKHFVFLRILVYKFILFQSSVC